MNVVNTATKAVRLVEFEISLDRWLWAENTGELTEDQEVCQGISSICLLHDNIHTLRP